MKLQDLIEKVREDKLDKYQLENYHTDLCLLKAQTSEELGNLKKSKALFMVRREAGISIASRKEEFDASPTGQRKIEMESYMVSLKSLIDAIKTKMYQTY